MPIGPGKYDHACTQAREELKAKGVILLVLEGEHGSGFSVQADFHTTLTLPAILEDVAKQIRENVNAVR